jgi:hypothetical protein
LNHSDLRAVRRNWRVSDALSGCSGKGLFTNRGDRFFISPFIGILFVLSLSNPFDKLRSNGAFYAMTAYPYQYGQATEAIMPTDC